MATSVVVPTAEVTGVAHVADGAMRAACCRCCRVGRGGCRGLRAVDIIAGVSPADPDALPTGSVGVGVPVAVRADRGHGVDRERRP